MLEIFEVKNQGHWNEWVAESSSPAAFLQTWDWGQFQKSLGHRVYRLQIPKVCQAQVIVKKLPLGRAYLEIPKGPVFARSHLMDTAVWQALIKNLAKIGRQEKAILVRINLPYDLPSAFLVQWQLQTPELLLHQREPEQTLLVDLTKSEEELLANMHEKSRYNIRLAERRGVVVRDASRDEAAFQKFLEILDETSRRDRITLWPPERFWKFREIFLSPGPKAPQNPHALFLVGEYQGKILAGAIVMLFGDAGTYLYAGSSGEERAANAPSAVLWQAIRESKRQGKRWYDMWGITPREAAESHPWAGITRFKSRYVALGQTGQEVYQPGTRDLILDKKFYRLFKLAKRLRV